MTPLFAIVKLTFKSALRSHVFQALLILLVLGVLLVPNTVKGDGTAYGFVQVSIDYSLWTISLILSMSAIWVGCSVTSIDIENGQLHMVVSKPVSRCAIFAGKLLGVLLLHAVLMILASASAFAFVQLQFNWQKFAPEEKARVQDEVMAGRRAYLPQIADIDARVADEFLRRKKSIEELSGRKFDSLPPAEQNKMLDEVRKQVFAGYGEIKPGPENTKYWEFSGLPPAKKGDMLCVRYKMFSGSADSKDQKISYGIWGVTAFVDDKMLADSSSAAGAQPEAKESKDKPKMAEIYALLASEPQRIVCASVLEFKAPAEKIVNDGKVRIGFTNYDMEGKTLVIPPTDGPKLLIKECSFLENFLRAVLASFMRVAVLAGIACTAGAIFSMPVAVFMVIAYISIGFFASFLIGTQANYGENPNADVMERFGLFASHAVMVGVMPLQRFEVSDKLANGELVEWSFMAKLFFECLVLKGVPLCLLGVWIYWRRELGISLKR